MPLVVPGAAVGMAWVGLTTVAEMAADGLGLVHGGFVFGLADYAAMLAVNDPLVVLGSAEVRFLRPVVVGERLVAEARREGEAGRRSKVVVEVRRAPDDRGDPRSADGEVVMRGEFVCFTLERHVLQTEPA